MTRNDVRRDTTSTGSYALSRATAEGELDQAAETAFSRCCVYSLVAAAFAGYEDGHRDDDDADADAARSNHGATRKPPERPHFSQPPATSAPRFISLQPPHHIALLVRPVKLPPLLYRSYGRGPLVRSICLVRTKTANRGLDYSEESWRGPQKEEKTVVSKFSPYAVFFFEMREIELLIKKLIFSCPT